MDQQGHPIVAFDTVTRRHVVIDSMCLLVVFVITTRISTLLVDKIYAVA